MDWTLHQGRAQDVLPAYAGSIDLIVTSPPYDGLRDFGGGMDAWDFEAVADACAAALSPGGVLVWNVVDAIVDGGETGTSLRQAIHFMDIGLRLHQTLYYERTSPHYASSNRYLYTVQYMFVFSNGKPKTANIIADRPNITAGNSRGRYAPSRVADEKPKRNDGRYIQPDTGSRTDIWRYNAGWNHMGRKGENQQMLHDHPSVFSYHLAADHIRSWSNPGDTVCDPMAGSGTTLRAAVDLGRKAIGIEVNPQYCDLIRRRMSQQVLL